MISVAVCTYNGEKHIKEQLNSIIIQTVLPDEVIICDDQSKDRTLDVIDRIVKNTKISFRVIRNAKNLGYRKNFEQAISFCKGDIIFLSDQDDIWHADKIEKVMSCFENPDVMMVHHNDVLVDEKLHILLDSYWDGMGFPLKKFRRKDMSPLFLRNYVQGSACAFRKCVYDVAAPFPLCAVHDEWLALIAMQLGKISSIEEPLMDYRQWGNNSIGVCVPKVKDKLNVYIYNLKKRMEEHIKEVTNRKYVFEALQKRLREKNINFVAPYDMTNFENERLNFIYKKRNTIPFHEYYSYCGIYEDTKQLIKDIIARYSMKELK